MITRRELEQHPFYGLIEGHEDEFVLSDQSPEEQEREWEKCRFPFPAGQVPND